LGKPAELAESCRPISLLSVLSRLFEKLLPLRFSVIMERQKIISNYQFVFRHKHAITEQIHRIVNRINVDMDEGRYYTAAFLDVVSQVFDKVGHADLLQI